MLYLASKSFSRKQLLVDARIPFTVIEQTADEQQCDWGLPLEQLVRLIAECKMKHAILPQSSVGSIIFVLTADTLAQDRAGNIHGKPSDYADATAKIKALRDGSRVCTAFCLQKMRLDENGWKIIDKIVEVVIAECVFFVDDCWIDYYFAEQSIALQAAGAMAIEQFGSQFLKSVHGSYTTIMGLPMFEVRRSLQQLGFFD